MAKVKDPILFSTHFKLAPEALLEAGLIDPFLNVDIPLFIDPALLEKSSNERIRGDALARFRGHFEIVVRMLAISEQENDAAWKQARQRLDLSEPPQNGLGYGGSGRSGSSRPGDIREQILRTAREIVHLGAKDPEMISLMGFFEEDVGPDTISDLTTTVIMEDLAAITEEFCLRHNVPLHKFQCCPRYGLPRINDRRGRGKPLVLVPCDIVRELPIANDWSDIESAAMMNEQIRRRVNEFLGGIIEPSIRDRKHALRRAALGSPADFDYFLNAVKDNVTYYDPNLDVLGYYRLKEIIAHGIAGLSQQVAYNLPLGPAEAMRVVRDTISHFKRHVENGNLWEELWTGAKPKKERASQLIYYAIADAFCKANNLDISPEAHMGGGPIDFKFSYGYETRILVEMKRSGGQVVHGYEKQLEFYKAASQTDYAIFVVMDFGDLGDKLTRIEAIERARSERGLRTSDIVVIDAKRKLSASKRES